VLLGGGCFANRLLSARLTQRLTAMGLAVFSAQAVRGDAGWPSASLGCRALA
jgi:hydrogenase maturation protein HypF